MVTKTIELTENEIKAVRLCLMADYKIYRDRVGHAASHGDEYVDDYGQQLERVIEKLHQ